MARSEASSDSVRAGTLMRVAILVVLLGVLGATFLSPDVRLWEREALVEAAKAGGLAPLILVLSYVLVSLLLLPAFPLDFAAGAHFGFWLGAAWVQVAASVASITGYALGRWWLRRWLERFLEWKPRFRGIQVAVQEEGARIVFLSRLSPIFSFSLLNVFYGAAGVPFWPYLGASVAGMLPGTAMYVYAGMMAGGISRATLAAPRTTGQSVMEVVGLVATAAVVIFVTRRAQRVLRERTGGVPGADAR